MQSGALSVIVLLLFVPVGATEASGGHDRLPSFAQNRGQRGTRLSGASRIEGRQSESHTRLASRHRGLRRWVAPGRAARTLSILTLGLVGFGAALKGASDTVLVDHLRRSVYVLEVTAATPLWTVGGRRISRPYEVFGVLSDGAPRKLSNDASLLEWKFGSTTDALQASLRVGCRYRVTTWGWDIAPLGFIEHLLRAEPVTSCPAE